MTIVRYPWHRSTSQNQNALCLLGALILVRYLLFMMDYWNHQSLKVNLLAYFTITLTDYLTGREETVTDLLDVITEVEADHLRKVRSPRSPILEKGPDYITLTMSPDQSASPSIISAKSKETESESRGRTMNRKPRFTNPLAKAESRTRKDVSTFNFRVYLVSTSPCKALRNILSYVVTDSLSSRMLVFRLIPHQSNGARSVGVTHFMKIQAIHAEL